jgi:rare lipoprotein A (peptidoglycan hydrolase)
MKFLAPLLAASCCMLATAAQAGGWATVHRYVHATGRCGSGREVMASWYCESGGTLAGGGRMDCGKISAASWEYPMHTMIGVTNPHNGRSCKVEINDTGPNGLARRMGDVLDLSSGASDCLGTGRNTLYVCVNHGGEYANVLAR